MHINMIWGNIKDYIFAFNLYTLCLPVVRYQLSNKEMKSGISFFFFSKKSFNNF